MTTSAIAQEVTYLEAISQALDEEMSQDERVFMLGEDIGPYGGAFRQLPRDFSKSMVNGECSIPLYRSPGLSEPRLELQ